MTSFNLRPPARTLEPQLRAAIDAKTKPPGALGQLEGLALQIGLIQNTLTPVLTRPHVVVFAGDHGVARSGVSAYPPEVTWQMVLNFLRGGAAINVFCRQHDISLYVVDAGVNHDFTAETPGLLPRKVARGTRNFTEGPAMTPAEVAQCLAHGAAVVDDIARTGCNVIGFGEMGIGNTSAAALLTSLTCGLPLERVTGSGTGLDPEGVGRKTAVLQKALAVNGVPGTPEGLLAAYGGLEIAQLAGAMLQAARHGMVVLVDGFISTAAYLVAARMAPALREYAVFCHQSGERGHRLALEHLGATPLLDLGMRLGEGTGAAVAYPLVQSAVLFLNQMASFATAGVTEKAL
jgi:nicotinate-nucleotide--dimethylbenzimidazole phosphoribosyltransferase